MHCMTFGGMEMEHFDYSREELQGMLSQLEQAFINHQRWYAVMMRSITCKLPSDQCDLRPDAYMYCRFGQWYYSRNTKKLSGYPGFIALGEVHKLMHKLAAELLIESQSGTAIKSSDYDNFTNALERMRLEISALTHELENLLYNHDSLTGAITKFGILPAFREQQELTRRGVQSCCIVMMDLDHFKDINDSHGHLAGDRVLKTAARYMIEHLRPYDKIFRYGGEEFLFLIQHTGLSDCYYMVERLREGLASTPIHINEKEPVHITASFGVVLLDPDLPVEASIDLADKAMYAAKAAGRNRVQIGSSQQTVPEV